MDELEHRLRSALTEMAEEVPPSHGAWEEHQRRLALKSRRDRRRPAVMAAVAAAVVALIAIPVVILNQQISGPVDPGSLPVVSSPPSARPTGPATSRGFQPPDYIKRNGEILLTKPVGVGAVYSQDNRKIALTAWAYTIRHPEGPRQVCIALTPEGSPINGADQAKYGEPDCTDLVQPKAGKYNWGRKQVILPQIKGTWVYVMDQPADKLFVRRAEGDLVVAQQKSPGDGVVLFVAYVSSTKAPKQFSVLDADHKTLENGE